MERLTERDKFGNATIKGIRHAIRIASYDMSEEDAQQLQEALDRLAYYEDSGFAPEKVEGIAAAIRAKRFMLLPCKLGTTLFRIVHIPARHKGYRETYFIRPVELSKSNLCEVVFEGKIGKTIFLKREAAEQALEEMMKGLEAKE